MVRGRKKCNSKTNKSCMTETLNTVTADNLQSKRKFKGKLSHSTTVSPNKITKYYNVSTSSKSNENSPILATKLDDNFPVSINEKNVLKTDTILESNQTNLCSSGVDGNNKTESCVPFSPSTALSQLDLNVNKKLSRIKKRLLTDDNTEVGILKPISELAGRNILKNNAENTSKFFENRSNSCKSQTKLTEFYPVRRSVRKTEKTVLEEKRKSLEEAVLSNKEDGLEVRIFEGKGRGIVAAKQFQKGDFVVEYAGELITIDEAKRRERIYSQDENTGCYMYYFKHKNNQYCVDATQETNRLGRLLNHSRNGNLCTKTIEVKGVPHLVLLAKEDIKPGCELTYDYGDRSKLSLQYHPWLAQ